MIGEFVRRMAQDNVRQGIATSPTLTRDLLDIIAGMERIIERSEEED